jgi:hypothetical protein
MFDKLNVREAHQIATLAREARDARDSLLHGAAEVEVGEAHPAKGEADRAGAGGFDLLTAAGDPSARALGQAIGRLKADARSELFVLMRIGQGELAVADWPRGISQAESLGDDSVQGILDDDIDLASHLNKALFELGLS